MERVIGLLGGEIKQHSNPYANLSQRALRWCQVNTLKCIIPDLDSDSAEYQPPCRSVDLSDGFFLLRARECYPKHMSSAECQAFWVWAGVPECLEQPKISRWARLRLPNGQIARSAWKECLKPLEKVRMARNVKVCTEWIYQTEKGINNTFRLRLTILISLLKSNITSEYNLALMHPAIHWLCSHYTHHQMKNFPQNPLVWCCLVCIKVRTISVL